MRPLFLCLSTFLLGGCVSYEAKPLVPADELSALRGRTLETFSVDRAGSGSTAPPIRASFDLSDGLDEGEIVAVALTLNPGLRAKRLETGEGHALLLSAGIWPNPEVGIGVRPGLGGAVGYTADADLLFALLRPGERAAREDVARSNLEKIRAEIVAEEWKVVAEARRRHLAVLAREQTLALLENERALRESAFELSQRRRGVGEGTELDVALSELELAEIRRDYRQAAAEVDVARQELNEVLGLPPAYKLSLSSSGRPLRFTVYTDVSEDEVDRRLLSGRFELRAAEAVYAKAENELRLAVSGQFPRFKLGPTSNREAEGTYYLGFGISVEIPLFDRNQGEIAAAEARREQKRAEYSSLLHGLRAAAHAALARVRRARVEVEAQERELLPLADRSRDLFERAFRARDIGAFEWVSVQQRVLKVRQTYLQALLSYQNAILELETSTGLALSAPTPESRP